MSTTLNRRSYERLIAEDIAWLEKMPQTLERDHILAVLRKAVEYEYGSEYAPSQSPEEPKTPSWDEVFRKITSEAKADIWHKAGLRLTWQEVELLASVLQSVEGLPFSAAPSSGTSPTLNDFAKDLAAQPAHAIVVSGEEMLEAELSGTSPEIPPTLECTGVAARWCPIHGDCTDDAALHDEEFQIATGKHPFSDHCSDRDCPLHGAKSTHAEPEAVPSGENRFAAWATDLLVDKLRDVICDDRDASDELLAAAADRLDALSPCPACKGMGVPSSASSGEVAAPSPSLVARITDYLSTGGLVNPELMEHEKVRDLLMDCRAALSKPPALDAGEIEGLLTRAEAFVAEVVPAHQPGCGHVACDCGGEWEYRNLADALVGDLASAYRVQREQLSVVSAAQGLARLPAPPIRTPIPQRAYPLTVSNGHGIIELSTTGV